MFACSVTAFQKRYANELQAEGEVRLVLKVYYLNAKYGFNKKHLKDMIGNGSSDFLDRLDNEGMIGFTRGSSYSIKLVNNMDENLSSHMSWILFPD